MTVALLTGCGLFEGAIQEDTGTVSSDAEIKGASLLALRNTFVEFEGAVVSDEPQATIIGNDILDLGGSAADAASAMALALAVTKPSSAGLAGGGVCLVNDIRKDEVFTLEFLAERPKRKNGKLGTMPPANLRGIAALHARLGRLPWGQVVGPAEKLARFGSQLTRSLARDIAAAGPGFARTAAAGPYRNAKTGKALLEGDTVVQSDLARLFSQVRIRGVGDFYTGQLGREFVASVNAQGGDLTIEDLRAVRPQWLPTISMDVGRDLAYQLPAPSAAGGIVAGQILGILYADDIYEDAEPSERPHLLAEAAKRAYGERTRWRGKDGKPSLNVQALVEEEHLETIAEGIDVERAKPPSSLSTPPQALPENSAVSSLAVIDRNGNAVVCNFTLGGLFGSGRVAKGTGLILPKPPVTAGGFAISFAPILLTSTTGDTVFMAATATGGEEAPTALAQVVLESALLTGNLEAALSRKRFHHLGTPDQIIHEPGLTPQFKEFLKSLGHTLVASSTRSRVNAILCLNGVPDPRQACTVNADPRGAGMALNRS